MTRIHQEDPINRMERIFYKVNSRGIVYLVDPATSSVYTYDLSDPTEIGKIVWSNPTAEPTIQFLENYMEILTQKRDLKAATPSQ